MTLREFGQSIVTYWENYIIQVTTQNILDWSIGNIFLTAFLGFFGLIIGGIIVGGAIAVLWVKVSEVWEKTGLPYTMDRLDKRVGPLYTGLMMVAGTITFFIVLGVIFALIETAQW